MHPWYVSLWMKLYDALKVKSNNNDQGSQLFSIICLLVIKEINKHGNSNRSEILAKQKLKQQTWVRYFPLPLLK